MPTPHVSTPHVGGGLVVPHTPAPTPHGPGVHPPTPTPRPGGGSLGMLGGAALGAAPFLLPAINSAIIGATANNAIETIGGILENPMNLAIVAAVGAVVVWKFF